MALAIVRINELTVSKMQVLFTDDLDVNIGIDNVHISSQLDSIGDPDIVSVEIENNILHVVYRPIFPNVQYSITFLSTDSQPFQTINGDRITEDGNRNALFFASPGEDENLVRDNMLRSVSSLYETEEPSVVRNLISGIASEFQKAVDVTQTVKSANYISITVEDERMVRDDGPIDKFANGGVFEVLRVASTPTTANSFGVMEFNDSRLDSFQSSADTIVNSILGTLTEDVISLQAIEVINEEVSDVSSLTNGFSGLKIRVANKPVIQVISVTLIRDSVSTYYDIERFGYTLRDNRYDTKSSSINVNLEDNEIELSVNSLTGQSGGFLLPIAGDELRVSYVYKKMGRDVNPDSVELSTIKNAVREVTPALVNRFALKHAPIITSGDEIPVSGGVEFLNTQAVGDAPPFTIAHPAFTREIRFDEFRLPSRTGEYSVNYNTGDVYVFGVDVANDGTGIGPPAASYLYREVFVNNLDYTFNSDRDELAIKSIRNIADIEAKISFEYEDTFAEGSDFRFLSHIEALNERVNNKLVSDFDIKTDHAPITDVFRIFNETTGEVYSPVRFNDTTITFSGRQAPRQKSIARERLTFVRVPQEALLVSDQLTNSSSLKIFKIALANNKIVDSHNRRIGANFDTSIAFSDTNIFVKEMFYESELFNSVNTNIDRLVSIGDYCVDYSNGLIYVAVSASQSTDMGDITYRFAKAQTRNRHILAVDNVYRSISALRGNVTNYVVGDIEDETVSFIGLEPVGERFINNDSSRVILVGSHQNGEDGITAAGSAIFTSNTALFTTDDLQRTLVVGSSAQAPVEEVTIVGVISDRQVVVDTPFSVSKTARVWDVIDVSENAPKTITLNNNIVSVDNIYLVEQLGIAAASNLDGYFDIERDSFEENVITLGADNPLQVGDAVIVNYNSGELYVDYTYLQDELLVSYEYGNNSLDWSISDTLVTGDEYFVTYKYGAMRESLLTNFGALTQIPQLTTFSPNLDREVYRSVVSGTLKSFLTGPTIPSIETLVESFTDVTPNITESVFSSWVLGRDHLHLRPVEAVGNVTYDIGKYNSGIVVGDGQALKASAVSHIRLNEGTIETWIRPSWKGLANDSTITFESLLIDGYEDLTKVFIGPTAINPDVTPFSLNIADSTYNVFGQPANIESDTGFFIWFDEFNDIWNIRWRENRDEIHEFSGLVSTSGEFFNVIKPIGPDGYDINEISDVITSTIKTIEFNAFIDGYDAEVNTEQYASDGISFASGDSHFIFDMAARENANRMSLFKDGTGYLNFQIFDNGTSVGRLPGYYNLSTNIRDWEASSLHHVAIAWKLNSVEEKDEMHLFVDGEEVPNLFKYGGNPKASSSYDFGNVGEETLISIASYSVVGAYDGGTEAGNNILYSDSLDFTALGVQVGDTLEILDETADGTESPNFGLPYNITGVGTTTIALDRNFTLTMGDIHFSINKTTATIDTPVNFQDFIVVVIDEDGNEVELDGLEADEPDYLVRRGANNTHVIELYNGVQSGDRVVIKTLGLIFRRCRERMYVYGEADTIRTNSAAPVSLGDVRITAVILPRTLISTGGGFGLVGTIIGAQLVTLLQSTITDVCQPSNSSAGRTLDITLTGDNFNFNIPGNEVVITGTTYSGNTQETLLFVESGTMTTAEYWTHIDSIAVYMVPIDSSQAAGIIEIKETKPLTESQNNGDKAEVVEYSNGLFRLETYGTGGNPFLLNEHCYYDIDYPSFLKIGVTAQPNNFYIGSDFREQNNFDGTIDEFRVLDYMMTDTRPGETVDAGESSITTDYNESDSFDNDKNTLFLAHFDSTLNDASTFRDRFDSGFEVANSVNDSFEYALKISNNKAYVLNNAKSVFNNDEGTIEFWVSPMDDTRNDPNYHYYVDMSTAVTEVITSSTAISVIATQRVREIESVRLATDTFNSGINYFIGGSISSVDNKTITLGIPLPSQNIDVKITYVPLNSQGDRVSIFKDPYGFINFFVKASGVEHIISTPISWDRHTWHRIMVMWRANSNDNQDRLRLFVDGSERGTIKYGTGLIYGTGVVYGQAEVRPGVNRFIVDNIDLTDLFPRIYIGSDVFETKGARARLDNIRFSEIERLQSIRITSNDTIDTNYYANTEAAIPVVEDDNTAELLDFNKSEGDIEFLATIIDAKRGIFRFEVEVIDSFDKVIGNTVLEKLLVDLINVIKPAHSEAIIKFTK